jgi:DNA-binding NarL/FixJ family response regulator
VSSPIRIAILDEYPAVRASLVAALADDGGFTVAGQAETGSGLMDVIDRNKVDVVLAEPWLRSNDGLDALTRIAATRPEVAIVALSSVWDDAHVQQLRAIGTRAYIPKSMDLPEVLLILRQVHDGLEIFPAADTPGVPALLTPRETEVLRLAADGLCNRDIADQLFVSERTVKFHLQNAYRKLGVGNRTAAAAAARRRGLV